MSRRKSGLRMLSTVMSHCPSMGNAWVELREHLGPLLTTNVISRFSYLNTISDTPCIHIYHHYSITMVPVLVIRVSHGTHGDARVESGLTKHDIPVTNIESGTRRYTLYLIPTGT